MSYLKYTNSHLSTPSCKQQNQLRPKSSHMSAYVKICEVLTGKNIQIQVKNNLTKSKIIQKQKQNKINLKLKIKQQQQYRNLIKSDKHISISISKQKQKQNKVKDIRIFLQKQKQLFSSLSKQKLKLKSIEYLTKRNRTKYYNKNNKQNKYNNIKRLQYQYQSGHCSINNINNRSANLPGNVIKKQLQSSKRSNLEQKNIMLNNKQRNKENRQNIQYKNIKKLTIYSYKPSVSQIKTPKQSKKGLNVNINASANTSPQKKSMQKLSQRTNNGIGKLIRNKWEIGCWKNQENNSNFLSKLFPQPWDFSI